MITPLKKNISFLILAAAVSAFGFGCAGTPTKESTGEYVDDSTITAKVKEAFLADKVVKTFQIDVNTFKGVVQLAGFVDNSDQKAAAARDAASVRGVTDVQNHISVK